MIQEQPKKKASNSTHDLIKTEKSRIMKETRDYLKALRDLIEVKELKKTA